MVYGIDLGTTYSAIAKLATTGAPEIINDSEHGSDILASAVYFAKDGSVIVGENAKEAGAEEPQRLQQFFKRWIGRGTDENREHYVVDGKEYDPIELSSIVLGAIVRYAKAAGEDVKDVVITCPAYFDNAQRNATRKAGELAGLNVLAMINEPTAAAIEYCANRFNEDQNVLVYDLGGGTFDVTLMRMSQNGENRSVDVLATDGDAFLGGYDWDKELYRLLLDKYTEQYGCSEEKMAEELKAEIRSRVEKLKISLSNQNKEKGKIKIPYDGENIVLEVTREEFEKATAGYVEQTIGWLNSVLKKAGKTDDDVDFVIMVGGSTRMPMIKDMLIKRFGEKAIFRDPDKTVAKGAAIVADMEEKKKDVKFLEQLEKQLADGNIRLVRDRGTGEITVVPVPGKGDEEPQKPGKLNQGLSKVLSEHFGTNDTTDDPIGTNGEQTDIDTEIATKVIRKQIKDKTAGTITTRDVAPRTFGIVACVEDSDGKIGFVVDNVVFKDEKLPCKVERTYYTPKDNATRIELPVIESISGNEVDSIVYNAEIDDYIFPDSSLDMKRRKELVLNITTRLPKDSEIYVDFELDEYANIYLQATIAGVTESIKFSFDETDPNELKEMAERQKNRIYAIGD